MSETRTFHLAVNTRYPDGATDKYEYMLYSSGVPTPTQHGHFIQWYTQELHVSFNSNIVDSWTLEEEVPEP